MKQAHRWLLAGIIALLAGALALGAIACSDDDDDGDDEEPTATAEAPAETEEPSGSAGTLEITGLDYSYEMPASIAGGVTTVEFTNGAEAEDHQATFLQLDDGVTSEDFLEAAATFEGEADAEALGTWVGGPGAGASGSNSNVIDLEVGEYIVLCLIPSPDDGTPHFEKGMVTPLTVTEPEGDGMEAPEADVDVELADFAFTGPDTIEAGETTFAVGNNGPQIHEMGLARVADGLTYDELIAILTAEPDPEAPPPEGPPPFTFVGQVSLLSNGGSGITTMDLAPGTYAMICFVTDPDTGAPHFALDMHKEITVE